MSEIDKCAARVFELYTERCPVPAALVVLNDEGFSIGREALTEGYVFAHLVEVGGDVCLTDESSPLVWALSAWCLPLSA